MASDFAVTDNGGDWTEHGVFGVDPDDNLYILAWWSGQTTSDVWIDILLDLIREWEPLAWFGESGVIRRSIEPFLNKRMRERKIYCRVEWVASTADKPTRARAFQSRAASEKVYLPNGETGNGVLDELLRFPASAKDNKVDVCSLIGLVIDQAHPAVVAVEPGKSRDAWDDAFDDDEEESWKTA
jgi:predicted phage terminase large subunit-like protein